MHAEVSRIVKAPREKVYAAYTDFEAKAVGREGTSLHTESEGKSDGRPRSSVPRMTFSPPERVEAESETRFTKTRRTVRFEEVPEGTKVTAVLDVQVKGFWGLIFAPRGRDEVEMSGREALESFVRYVESLS